MDSSSSIPPTLHLAMAALFGASFMALFAFYMHRRTVYHVLHRLADIRRSSSRRRNRQLDNQSSYDDDDGVRLGFDRHGRETVTDLRSYTGSFDDNAVLRSLRSASSLTNVAAFSRTGWFEEEPRDRASSLDNLNLATSGIPPLPTDGGNAYLSSSYKGRASLGRTKNHRSPSCNAFESAEGSDEEGSHHVNDSRIPYGLNANHANNQMYGEISKCQKDLAFVNSLLPPGNTMNDPTNIEEEEVCKMLRECLDLRKKYVYKENVAPWKAEPVIKNSDPFNFEPVEATAHYFRMEDGVVHVYASKIGKDWKWNSICTFSSLK